MSLDNIDISTDVLKATAASDPVVRSKAITEFFTAIQLPVRQAIFDGDNTSGIFTVTTLPPGVSPEIPVDIIVWVQKVITARLLTPVKVTFLWL